MGVGCHVLLLIGVLAQSSLISALKYALFIGHRVDWGLTMQSLGRTLEIGPDNIRLIDTSAALTQEDLRQVPNGVKILDPTIPLSFSQMQEYMRKTAKKEDLDVYFWIHSDVLLSEGTALKAVEAVEQMMTFDPKWGILFFSYDLFCAFSVDAVSQIPWDLAIPHYKADYDYYQSMHQWKRTMYGRAPNSIRTQAVPAHLPWPKSGSVKHVSHGSVLIREIKNHSKNLAMTEEELWGYWLTDYVGRYIYFMLKWGYAWPDSPLEHFDSVHNPWAWVRIFLRLPSPGVDNFRWNVFKIYVAVALIALPLLISMAILYACWRYRQWRTRKAQKQTEHKTI